MDEDRTFYVLENKESSDEITLLMDMNYTDEEVPKTMTWCSSGSSNTCNHDGLDPYIEKIQTKFGSKVTVGIPSEEQIKGAYTGSIPQWLYDYLNDSPNQVPYVYGYWTSTGHSSFPDDVWIVDCNGGMISCNVSGFGNYGLRPVITISKSDL